MDIYRKRKIVYLLIQLTVFGLVGIIGLFLWNVWIGAAYTLIFLVVLIYIWRTERETYVAIEKYLESLAFRMKKVRQEALLEMPIGIILINDKFEIEWANPYMSRLVDIPTLIGQDIFILSEELKNIRKSEDKQITVTIQNRKYKVIYKQEEKLLYFFDVTEQLQIEKQYNDERTVIAILYIDNYDDITKGMDDQSKSVMNATVTSIVNNWAEEYGIFIKRIETDRYLAILNESILSELEKKKFSILDDVREKTAERNLSLTLSVGIGAGSNSLIELGELAQSSLDLVLGRGGDQVAIKQPTGKIKFYGGKTNPVEKRTRVRARVISHALRDLIQDSDQVFIMGHKDPDMDSIGAGIGVRKMTQMNNVEGYVVLEFDELYGSVERLMNEINGTELENYFISPEEALARMTDKSLLVVVDTHRPSLVADGTLLKHFDKIVVIDHHRRGEEFITNPTLVYMEPYASSTAELVTELLEYQPDDDKLTKLEATALLAGIIVDTKSFTLRTGARTFEAASYLRKCGADTVLVQRLLKEDIESYIERSKIIQNVQFIYPGIVVAHGENGKVYDSVLIAQTADILLTLKDVNASFVIAHRTDGLVGISARSLGDVNVQIIMEKLGGGGHLTNAACQLEVDSIQDAMKLLKTVIIETLEGSNEQ